MLSLIKYGLRPWGNTNETLTQRAQKLKKFPAKVAARGCKRRGRATPGIKELKWIKIREKVEYDECVMVYKATHNHYPEWLLNFPSAAQLSELIARQNIDLFIPKVRTDNGERSILASGPRVWNKLLHDIKELPSLVSFKKALTTYALQGGFWNA